MKTPIRSLPVSMSKKTSASNAYSAPAPAGPEGDLLLIPAQWWHQTYALEPSLAVSSQYMNEANSQTILNHIAEWCGSTLPPVEELKQLPPQLRVLNVLQAA